VRLGPRSFRPPPAVDSTVTVWRRRSDAPGAEAEDKLRACLAACFARRRQTLRNNLRRVLPRAEVEGRLARAGLDGALRAERVEPSAFERLAADWTALPVPPPGGPSALGDLV
jgi:16S rRNA A1518/A1519 N6-dimethyltransferase RsmA/KsgA/DIM1 with predicted DNA glycosylase/AP lyase activity